ncbi:hypothetical protein P1P68_05540 [Streptomyces scabiei]|uniref:hypothetical protein n=1 Tax=Streptomyces scabiei TaxID=1930 RepID=UPI0029902685|nr:hypothetical protein [Streptomyces scabiei]MDW8804266.1 hypothetical protein [Streptomyces scabiei]
MAAVSLETTELQTMIETCLTNPARGMEFLNAFRVKNSGAPAALPANFGPGDLTRPHDAAWRTALANITADLEA